MARSAVSLVDLAQVEMTKRDALTQCESIEAQVRQDAQVQVVVPKRPERWGRGVTSD